MIIGQTPITLGVDLEGSVPARVLRAQRSADWVIVELLSTYTTTIVAI